MVAYDAIEQPVSWGERSVLELKLSPAREALRFSMLRLPHLLCYSRSGQSTVRAAQAVIFVEVTKS